MGIFTINLSVTEAALNKVHGICEMVELFLLNCTTDIVF